MVLRIRNSVLITPVLRSCLLNLLRIFKKILHLWKFPVISKLRTNFAEMPGKSHDSGSRDTDLKGDAVVRVSRLRRKP